MNDQPEGGMEVAVDLADMVQVLTQENAELHQQVTMLKAAVLKLRREAGDGHPTLNGQGVEVADVPAR